MPPQSRAFMMHHAEQVWQDCKDLIAAQEEEACMGNHAAL